MSALSQRKRVERERESLTIYVTPDINPIYVGLGKSFPRDSKNISFVDMGLVKTGLDLIKSYGWKMGENICGFIL